MEAARVNQLNLEAQQEREFRVPPIAPEGTMAATDQQSHLDALKRRGEPHPNIALFESLLAPGPAAVPFHELTIRRSDPAVTRYYIDNDNVPDSVDVIRYVTRHGEQPAAISGPTLLMRRDGRRHLLELENELLQKDEPVLRWVGDHEPTGPTDWWKLDAPHDLFSTNLHTHGLHVSPGAEHDNVFLSLPPRESLRAPNELFLSFRLPRDHTAGTYFYHAHHHGAVAYQLLNGMAGALIVPGDPDNPNDLESVPEVARANRIEGVPGEVGRIMLLQQFVFAKTSRVTADGAPIWVVDPADVNDREEADPDKNDASIVADLDPNAPDHPTVLTTNGVQAPTIGMKRGSLERWRFIHAGKESEINAQWVKQQGDGWVTAPSDAMVAYEIAVDGTPTGDLLRYDNAEDPDAGLKHLRLFPGYRSDVLLQADHVQVGDVYALVTREAPRLNPQRRRRTGKPVHVSPDVRPFTIAVVKITGDGPVQTLPAAEAFARWKPQELTPAGPPRAVGFHFIDTDEFGVLDGPTPAATPKPYAETAGLEQIPLKMGQVAEWSISVDDGSHPFHIHVNPFQVRQPLGQDENGHDLSRWIWRDTLLVTAGSPVNVRFKPTDFAGRSVLHCHILDHEDQGMMKEIYIDSDDPNDFPELRFLRERDGGAPLPSVIGADGKRQIVVVFQGMVCGHCIEQLRDLARVSTHFEDAEVTALSTRPLPSDVDAKIAAPAGAPFRVLKTVADKQLLEKLDLSAADKGEHAVIIWDKDGKERYRYVGPQPLPDDYEAVYALRNLPR